MSHLSPPRPLQDLRISPSVLLPWLQVQWPGRQALWLQMGHLLPEWYIRISHACFGKNSYSALILVESTVAWIRGGQAPPGHIWVPCCLNCIPKWLKNCGQKGEHRTKPITLRSYKQWSQSETFWVLWDHRRLCDPVSPPELGCLSG